MGSCLAAQQAYCAFGLVAEHLDAKHLGAVACCSRTLSDAMAECIPHAKALTTIALRERLLACSWGRDICKEGAKRLSLDGQVAATELPTLIRYVACTGVTEFKLRRCIIGKCGMQALSSAAGRGMLDGLHTLNLSHDYIDSEGMEMLVEKGLRAGGLRHLRTLNLSNNYFSDSGLKSLCTVLAECAGAVLLELTILRIAGSSDEFRDASIRTLASTLTEGALPALQQLVVPHGFEKHAALLQVCRNRHIKLL